MKNDFKLTDFLKKRNVVIAIIVSVVVILAIGIAIAVTLSKSNRDDELQTSASESEFHLESGHIHNFTQIVDKKFLESEATCAHKATYYYSCVCGVKENKIFEYGDYASHNIVVDEAVAPTKTKPGYTEGKHCSVCGLVIVEQKYVSGPGSQGLEYTLNTDGYSDGYIITGIGSCTDKEVVIPTAYDGKKVVAIADRAFSECDNITSVSIPETIEKIGARVFYGCTGLTSIRIPSSVTEVGTQVFYKASNLSTVYYESNYYPSAKFWDNSFLKLPHIKNIVLNMETIPWAAFYNHDNFENVVIGNKVKEISGEAFSGCIGLTGIYMPDNVKSIGSGAFENCKGLKTVKISNSITEISHSAFSGCVGLTEFNIPDSVTSIGSSAFSGCSGLTSIVIPNSVTSIGSNAFSACTGLTSAAIPDSITSINSGLFSDCSELATVKIPDSVIKINSSAFFNCSSLANIDIPDSVETIGERAFIGCKKLKNIIIPKGVKYIGLVAFYGSELNVLYKGSAEQWESLNIYFEVSLYFYSEIEPVLNADGTAYDGNYWHYDTDGETPVIWEIVNQEEQ